MSRATALISACLLMLSGLGVGLAPAAYPSTTVEKTLTYRVTPSTTVTGGVATMTGQLLPATANALIWVQQERSPGSWNTVRQLRTDSAGRFSTTVKVSLLGAYRFRARLIDSSTPAVNSPTRVISVFPRPTASQAFASHRPAVSGVFKVGARLTAATVPWTPTPSKLYYQWLRDGTRITGATTRSYVLTAADYGTYITVEAKAGRNGGTSRRESVTQTPVRAGTFVASTPTISGGHDVKSVLTAQSTWSPSPEVVAHQWTRDGVPIAGADYPTYTVQPADAGKDVRVSATAHHSGYTPLELTSAPHSISPEPVEPVPTDPVPTDEPAEAATFGEKMRPASSTLLPKSEASVTFSAVQPDWFAHNSFIRWDTPGAFSHSLDPVPYRTLTAAAQGDSVVWPSVGAEYHLNNSLYKYSDVSFDVTGKKFAIRYWTYKQSDAMVWIDGKPAASSPFEGSDSGGTGRWNWLVVTRSSDARATVRLAGPMFFSGVDHDVAETVTVAATPPRFTLGVVSDSMFESMPSDPRPATNGPAQTLSTLTGFRVWNMAEGGTGYINDGSGTALTGDVGHPGHKASAFGSDRRIASIAAAPIDALLVNGSLNDRWWSASEHRAAMDTFLNAVAEVRPDLPVVLVSLEPISSLGIRDQEYAPYRALNDNFAPLAAEHPNVVGLIDPYTADWLTGTGSTAHPANDGGNQDEYVGSDNFHLSPAGNAYYQGRIVDELRSMPLRPPAGG